MPSSRNEVLTLARFLILSLNCFIFVETWQDHSECGFQRVPLKPEPLIVGGQLAQDGEWPWIASLHEFNEPVCGATLITPEWVITAAHCMEIITDGSAYSVVVGTTDIGDLAATHQSEVVEDIFVHPNYHPDFTDFDLALLKLRRPLNLTDHVTTACLPTRSMEGAFQPGRAITMAGWGTQYQGGRLTNQLREVTVALVNRTICRQEYLPDPITDNMICAGPSEGGKDSCQGDSGGPTVTKLGDQWWLIGVIIGGVGCAVPGFRGVSASTIAFQDWINPIFEGGEPVKKVVTCSESVFQCQGGWCVPHYAKCDGYPDCTMGTDEAYCDGVLKLFDPFFYRRVANRSSMFAVSARDVQKCARACLDAPFPCRVFEFSRVDYGQVYECLIGDDVTAMVQVPLADAKRTELVQFIRKTSYNISIGRDTIFSAGSDVILSPSYFPMGSQDVTTNVLSWFIRLPEYAYNTITFKMLAQTGHADCGQFSSFALLSVNGAANATVDVDGKGKIGMSKCLGDFVRGETFNIEAVEVLVKFYSSNMLNIGFMLEYNARWLCNETFIVSPGSLHSPRFLTSDKVYPPNVRCHYSITAPTHLVVKLDIEAFIIEPDESEGVCAYDSFGVYDGDNENAPRLAWLCGFSTRPFKVTSTSNRLHLVFVSDESQQYRGFVASFTFVDPLNDAQGKMTDATDESYDASSSSASADESWDEQTPSHQIDEVITRNTSPRTTVALTPPHRRVTTQSKSSAVTKETKHHTYVEVTLKQPALPSITREKSVRIPTEAVFKIILAVHVTVFVVAAIVFSFFYCRIKRENARLNKYLRIYRNGNMIQL